jgi:hypothetical protein
MSVWFHMLNCLVLLTVTDAQRGVRACVGAMYAIVACPL